MEINKQYLANADSLGIAIVHYACKDYMTAYKTQNKGKMKSIENFFYSDFFIACTLGTMSADYIIRQIKREVDNDKLKQMKRNRTSGLYKSKPRRIKKVNTDE